MKNVPWYVWVCGTVFVVTLVVCFTVMGVTGTDTSDLWMFVGRLSNIVGALFGMVGGGAAIAAAKSSHQAAEQTNGNLTPTVKSAVAEALDEHDAR